MTETNASTSKKPKLRLGIVGGGKGSFIGPVHLMSARLDDRYELVAGALSSKPQIALESAAALGLSPQRSYSSYAQMAIEEAKREDGCQVVSIATPNHLHVDVAQKFMDQGIHVICDKPLSSNLDEARSFAKYAKTSKAKFFLTHNYSAYPMVRLMRDMIERGQLGKLRVINMEYLQEWLAADGVDSKQAQWRNDPAQAGIAGAVADIGTHAYHLATYVCGLRAETVSADLQKFGADRALDDNAHLSFRFEGGVFGSAWISQIAIGHECGLRLRIVGTQGSVEFFQENPNHIRFSPINAPTQIITRGGPNGSDDVRVPSGHPEGYIEGFATLYRDIADAILGGATPQGWIPDASAGLEGMAFISAVIASNEAEGKWTKLSEFH